MERMAADDENVTRVACALRDDQANCEKRESSTSATTPANRSPGDVCSSSQQENVTAPDAAVSATPSTSSSSANVNCVVSTFQRRSLKRIHRVCYTNIYLEKIEMGSEDKFYCVCISYCLLLTVLFCTH